MNKYCINHSTSVCLFVSPPCPIYCDAPPSPYLSTTSSTRGKTQAGRRVCVVDWGIFVSKLNCYSLLRQQVYSSAGMGGGGEVKGRGPIAVSLKCPFPRLFFFSIDSLLSWEITRWEWIVCVYYLTLNEMMTLSFYYFISSFVCLKVFSPRAGS